MGFWSGFALGMGCASVIWLAVGFVLKRLTDDAIARTIMGRMW